MSSLNDSIVALLTERGSRILGASDIHERLTARGVVATREDVDTTLEDLESSGRITAIRGRRFSLLEFTPYVSGRLRVHNDGSGTIRIASGSASGDARIERRGMRGGMNGDLVLARIESGGSRSPVALPSAEIVRILVRAHRTVVGRLHLGESPYVKPFDRRIDRDVYIDARSLHGARDGEMVHVEIERYPDRTSEAFGRVIECLGMLGEPGVDIEVVIRKYELPVAFPPAVLDAAANIEETIPESDLTGRIDLRDRLIVTIDGETARDFDDAVEAQRLGGGRYRLSVHIADVSHYVREGTPLDVEAFERGTSVYFPGRAIPMLPERLSNGICSLNPRVDRLTFSVEVEIDSQGRMQNRKFFKSVIRTRERMTYTDVNTILTGDDPELRVRYAEILELLETMRELYEILNRRRSARGSIDFDFPEADVQLGEAGEIETIMPSDRNVAHRLIEEFMLVANELVATHLVLSDHAGIYRVHQQPDPQKLEDLRTILAEFGHKIRGDMEELHPAELRRVLAQIEGTPEERFLSELILRSMKRAAYSADSTGHFALALQHYCHFTSPIRRYPDLETHRLLDSLIRHGASREENRQAQHERLSAIALQSSERERRAESADREVLEWKKVIFMRERVGSKYPGRVIGVVPFGLFVELDEIFVQGLVPVASMGGDYWVFVERAHRLRGSGTGRELRLGDRVVIEVAAVDEDRRQVEFRLLSLEGDKIEPRDASRRRRPRARPS